MTRAHAHQMDGWEGYEPVECIEISERVCLQPFVHSNAPAGVVLNTPEADAYGDHLGGFIFGHDRAWDYPWRCEGAVSVCGHGNQNWTMTGSVEAGDLTLAPSILCKNPIVDEVDGKNVVRPDSECGFHGFIRAGKWVPA